MLAQLPVQLGLEQHHAGDGGTRFSRCLDGRQGLAVFLQAIPGLGQIDVQDGVGLPGLLRRLQMLDRLGIALQLEIDQATQGVVALAVEVFTAAVDAGQGAVGALEVTVLNQQRSKAEVVEFLAGLLAGTGDARQQQQRQQAAGDQPPRWIT